MLPVLSYSDYAFVTWANEIKPGHSMFYALDLRVSRMALILVPTACLPDPPATLEVCGSWEADPEIAKFFVFKALSVKVGEKP